MVPIHMKASEALTEYASLFPADRISSDHLFVKSNGIGKKLLPNNKLRANAAHRSLKKHFEAVNSNAIWTYNQIRKIGILKLHNNGLKVEILSKLTGLDATGLDKILRRNDIELSELHTTTKFFDD